MDGFAIFGGEPPEEVKQEMQRRRELHEMAHESSVAQMDDFLDRLSEDDLEFLRGLLVATQDDDKDSFSQYMNGLIRGLQKHKFGMCRACGKKHESIPTTEEHRA